MEEQGGAQKMRNIRTTAIRSIPSIHRAMDIELFVLKRAKDKLEQEKAWLRERKRAVEEKLRRSKKRIENMHNLQQAKRSQKQERSMTKAEIPEKHVMTITY